ncbi:hypothetical protein EVAR_18072_1 [Eumeta japonica]|uniref:Uncharacterized protein n=1 Tax=Eumeta variegata TaxID=151549 RepID=A0A4C1VHS0_EUMVA|nr:hypothetical protein EVAR_18072_1 [Eumeta japonica]
MYAWGGGDGNTPENHKDGCAFSGSRISRRVGMHRRSGIGAPSRFGAYPHAHKMYVHIYIHNWKTQIFEVGVKCNEELRCRNDHKPRTSARSGGGADAVRDLAEISRELFSLSTRSLQQCRRRPAGAPRHYGAAAQRHDIVQLPGPG